MTLLEAVGVALVGGVGALARFAVDAAVSARTAGRFPLGTLAANITGSALLGLLTGLGVAGDALLLAGTGVLGSYTTFSTWMLESHRLAEEGALRRAGTNLALSLALGLVAAAAGRALGRAL